MAAQTSRGSAMIRCKRCGTEWQDTAFTGIRKTANGTLVCRNRTACDSRIAVVASIAKLRPVRTSEYRPPA